MFTELTKLKAKLQSQTGAAAPNSDRIGSSCADSESAGFTFCADKMMSQHINSVLEHLRIGCSLKKATPPTPATTTVGAAPTISAEIEPLTGKSENVVANNSKSFKHNGSACDEVDKMVSLSTGNNVAHYGAPDANRKVVQVNRNEVAPVMLCASNDVADDRNFNPKKRFSIPGGPQLLGNGDVRNRNRDLSPVPRNMPRKLSQDLRFRGSNSQLNDDGFDSRIRRPIKVKHLTSSYETYDTLHVKAIDVSIHFSILLSVFIFSARV